MKNALKLAILFLSFSVLLSACGSSDSSSVSSTGWTWVSGRNTAEQAGAYGTKGTPDSTNVPGARFGSVSWIDAGGKLWLFGGVGFDSTETNGELNDLWKYDPATLEWTWVSGSDVLGQPGVYGTKGTPAPTNVPGARSLAASWIDSGGKLWLFAGSGLDSAGARGDLNDLWTYDPATLEWTWVSGGNVTNQKGSYGTKGTPASTNVPGERESAISWIDSSGGLWLFGGFGADAAGSHDHLNDLWKFDPTSSQWTWVSGSSAVNQAGTYGTQGTTSLSNVPGARARAVSWIDATGKLWLFGGSGYDSAGTKADLNDLWSYTR
jgi:N-acetylneuraminic acid mutarotase